MFFFIYLSVYLSLGLFILLRLIDLMFVSPGQWTLVSINNQKIIVRKRKVFYFRISTDTQQTMLGKIFLNKMFVIIS